MSENNEPPLIECSKACEICCVEADLLNIRVAAIFRVLLLIIGAFVFLTFLGSHVYCAVIEKPLVLPHGVLEMIWAFLIAALGSEGVMKIYSVYRGK